MSKDIANLFSQLYLLLLIDEFSKRINNIYLLFSEKPLPQTWIPKAMSASKVRGSRTASERSSRLEQDNALDKMTGKRVLSHKLDAASLIPAPAENFNFWSDHMQIPVCPAIVQLTRWAAWNVHKGSKFGRKYQMKNISTCARLPWVKHGREGDYSVLNISKTYEV